MSGDFWLVHCPDGKSRGRHYETREAAEIKARAYDAVCPFLLAGHKPCPGPHAVEGRPELLARLATAFAVMSSERHAVYKKFKKRRRDRKEREKRRKSSERMRQARKRKEVREFIRSERNGPCTDCHELKPGHMSFDHLPQFEKSFCPGDANKRSLSMQIVRDELAKTELTCCVCHDRREKERGRPGHFCHHPSHLEEARAELAALTPEPADKKLSLRRRFLKCQIGAIEARLRHVQGAQG